MAVYLGRSSQQPRRSANDLILDFTHNPAGQIATNARSNDTYAWTNHYAVNRPYTANGLNQYTAAGGITPSYDARGNLIATGGASFVYNARNQLWWAHPAAPGTALYYDPLGRMSAIIANNWATITRLLHDGGNLIAERDNASGNILRRYVHGPGTDEPLVWYEGSGTSDRRWLHADERGSVIAISNGSGSVTNVNSYDESGIPASTNVGRFQYTGQQWIAEMGMYYYRARIYSPTMGRFMQTDPIGFGGGMNHYAYVGNDPVNFTDPSGLACDGSDGWDGVIVCARPLSVPGGGGGGTNANASLNTLINENVECKDDSAEEENCEIVVNGRRTPFKRGVHRSPGVVRGGNVAAGGCPNGGAIERMNVTAYTNGFESTGKRPGDPGYGVTADGSQAGPGTIAAPRSFPFGTRMYVPGYGLGTVHDRGGAITAGHLDLWFATVQQALQWGRKMVNVQVCR